MMTVEDRIRIESLPSRTMFVTGIMTPNTLSMFDRDDVTIVTLAEPNSTRRWHDEKMRPKRARLVDLSKARISERRRAIRDEVARHDAVLVGVHARSLAVWSVAHEARRKGRLLAFWAERRDKLSTASRMAIRRLLRDDLLFAIGTYAFEQYRLVRRDVGKLNNFPYSYGSGGSLSGPRPAPAEALRVLTMGYVRRKNAELAVRSFELAQSRLRTGASLSIVGPSLKWSQSTRCRAVPEVEPLEMPRLLDEFDVLMILSIFDGWGVVVEEAMAAGLVVIASDRVGAAPDLVVDGQSGFIVALDDARAIADRLVELDDPTTYEQMSKASTERCLWHRSKYNFESLVGSMVRGARLS